MTKRHVTLIHFLKQSNKVLFLFCLLIYALDLTIGDGDGVIEKWKLNPLKIFITGQILILLVRGILSGSKLISNLSLATLSLFFALVISEVIILNLIPGIKTTHQWIKFLDGKSPYTKFDTIFFKNYRPGSVFQYQLIDTENGKTIPVTINSDGVRGPEINAKKTGEERVLLIGDSFIQALQVDYENTLGQVLEQMTEDSIKVIQHGFPSWSPLLELNWLLKKGILFKPDKVILFLCYNDFFSGNSVGDTGYMPYTIFDKNGFPDSFQFGEAKKKEKRNPWNLMARDFRQIQLYRWLRFSIRKNIAKQQIPESNLDHYLEMPADDFAMAYSLETQKDPLISLPWDLISLMRDTSLWDEHVHQRVNLSFSFINLMKTYLDEQNVKLYVSLVPHALHFKNEHLQKRKDLGWTDAIFTKSGLQSATEQMCKARGIEFINLYEQFLTFKVVRPDSVLYLPVDGHWTERGHELVAKSVSKYVKH